MRILPWIFAAGITLGAATSARANGRFPAAQYVLVGPGAGADTIVLRATFGIVVSDDGGASFHYVCEEALGYGGGDNYDPPLALDAMGRLHSGLTDGLGTLGADRCTLSRDNTLEGMLVSDLDSTRAGGVVIAGAASLGASGRAQVFRSDDGGGSFRVLGNGVPGATVDTLEAAPTDATRVYVTMRSGRPVHASFYRSDDGGATLTEFPLPMADEGNGAFIAAVDPTDKDTVYVRLPLTPTFDPDAGTVRATVLLRTRDGGQSWSEIARSHGSMLGFAISDDGRTLWYGGPNANDRLERSDDGGSSFSQVNANVRVQCLRQHAGVLYVCADFTQDGFALGRSSDGGGTVTPLLRFGDVAGAFACASDSPETQCGPRWTVLDTQYFSSGNATSDAGAGGDSGARGDAGMDSGSATAADAGSGGTGHGGCRARPGSARGGAGVWFALALSAWIARRYPRG